MKLGTVSYTVGPYIVDLDNDGMMDRVVDIIYFDMHEVVRRDDPDDLEIVEDKTLTEADIDECFKEE